MSKKRPREEEVDYSDELEVIEQSGRKKLTEEEKYELIEEYIDDLEHLYEDPVIEAKRSIRLSRRLIARNVFIAIGVFLLTIFLIGVWRTASIGNFVHTKDNLLEHEFIGLSNNGGKVETYVEFLREFEEEAQKRIVRILEEPPYGATPEEIDNFKRLRIFNLLMEGLYSDSVLEEHGMRKTLDDMIKYLDSEKRYFNARDGFYESREIAKLLKEVAKEYQLILNGVVMGNASGALTRLSSEMNVLTTYIASDGEEREVMRSVKIELLLDDIIEKVNSIRIEKQRG